MGETSLHADLVNYLLDVLKWLLHGRLYAIYDNLNFYQTADPYEYPIAPDIAIIKGIAHRPTRSWRVGKSGPAPQVVFEIASQETWQKDLAEKPAKYARMGVQEYFAYDPNEPPLSHSANRRLFGWRLDQGRQVMKEILPGSNGSLWSASLESWLVPDGTMLRLYDHSGQMRLTGMEAEARQRQAADQRADMAVQQAEAEARRAQAETQRADAAIQQAEIEARRARILAEKMRSLGIDPDQLL